MTQSGFKRLSGDYNRGYTKAIQDIIEVFDYIQLDLKHHKKRITHKIVMDILRCCLENRERLRESINGFVRYNRSLEDFEFYEPDRNK